MSFFRSDANLLFKKQLHRRRISKRADAHRLKRPVKTAEFVKVGICEVLLHLRQEKTVVFCKLQRNCILHMLDDVVHVHRDLKRLHNPAFVKFAAKRTVNGICKF